MIEVQLGELVNDQPFHFGHTNARRMARLKTEAEQPPCEGI